MFLRLFGRALAVLALVLGLSASATIVIAQTIEQMARRSPLILRGTVLQQQSRWDDERRRINTYVELAVTDTLKGQAPRSILVRQPGGIVEELGQRVSGTASFSPREDVLVFLETVPDEAGVFGVYSLAAGKVSLSPNALGEKRATRDLTGLAFLHKSPTGERQIKSVGELEDLGAAEAFVDRVRKAIAGGKP